MVWPVLGFARSSYAARRQAREPENNTKHGLEAAVSGPRKDILMPKDSGVSAPGGEAALRLLAAALVPHLSQHFKPTDAQTGYYSQHDSPLGRTRHLELARRGTLPAIKVGRRVFVLRESVHAYIEQHRAAPRPESADDADILADWGLTSRSAR